MRRPTCCQWWELLAVLPMVLLARVLLLVVLLARVLLLAVLLMVRVVRVLLEVWVAVGQGWHGWCGASWAAAPPPVLVAAPVAAPVAA